MNKSVLLVTPPMEPWDSQKTAFLDTLETALGAIHFTVSTPFRDGYMVHSPSSAPQWSDAWDQLHLTMCATHFVVALLDFEITPAMCVALGVASTLGKPIILYCSDADILNAGKIHPAITSLSVACATHVGSLVQVMALARDLYVRGNAPLPPYYREHMRRFAYPAR